MIKILLIPEERKSVLIGRNGKVRKAIEKKTNTKIAVAVENDVTIEGEGLDVLNAEEIVKAIARGFSPQRAFILLDEEYQLNVITLNDEKYNTIKRLLARVIGRDGRTRRKIEQLTGSYVSVYGKTVSIIGKSEGMDTATRAIEQLLEGRSHGYVYRRMEKSREKTEQRYI